MTDTAKFPSFDRSNNMYRLGKKLKREGSDASESFVRAMALFERSILRPVGMVDVILSKVAILSLQPTTMFRSIASLVLLHTITVSAQGPDLIGYWHNWNDGAAPYLELSAVDPRYSIVEVSFAVPAPGTTHDMMFSPAETDEATFLADIAALQAQGRKVLISIGGATATVHLDSDAARDQFVASMLVILDTYHFDGIDIDLEGASVGITGGTIANPMDLRIIRLIDAVQFIGDAFQAQHGYAMMLTMAPETAYVQGGQSAFGGIWGAYLPLIDGLRDRLDILQVQLYNSGSMFGINGAIYEQGTADFIVSQTEALLQGFQTNGGFFAPLPPEKVAIGLPACPSAAGGGYVPPEVLAQAVAYLRGTGPQPGSYQRVASYPTLRGLMTWSINWDAIGGCAAADEFANSYTDLFDITTAVTSTSGEQVALWPMPVRSGGTIHIAGLKGDERLILVDASGRTIAEQRARTSVISEFIVQATPGMYLLIIRKTDGSDRAMRVVVEAG